MGRHNIQSIVSDRTDPFNIVDPGDGGAIPSDRTGTCAMTSTGADTRTVADPVAGGLFLGLHHAVDGGTVAVTFASAFNKAGDTIATFTLPDTTLLCMSVPTATGFVWRAWRPDLDTTDPALT